MSAPFTHAGSGTPSSAWRADSRWSDVVDVSDRLTAGGIDRVVVVAAHPDDETLGAAGVCARAHRLGLGVEVVLLTAGEHSHPDSPTTAPDALARLRRAESAAALRVVAPSGATTYVGIEDGCVAAHEDAVVARLVQVLGDARRTLLVAPWRHDGHPDHEAAGRGAAVAARRTGASLLEYPIWSWHWGRPDDAPWSALRAIALTEAEVEAKRFAIAQHATQVAPLSEAPGDEVLLRAELLAHFTHDRESYFEEPLADSALDDLHHENPDPWGVDTRWYEARKRDLLLAMLPRPRFQHALELGCSTGALAAALAARCERLDAVDSSAGAVAAARRRLAESRHVVVHHLEAPRQWPAGRFDLVVLSEVGYFLSPTDLDQTMTRAAAALAPNGVVVLCHWRHEIVGWPLDGAAVHRRVTKGLGLPVAARYLDRDVEILVLCAPDDLPDPGA